MGTRNLTAVMIGGQYKIAQYGQWDGYPEGQGIRVLKFLQKKENRERLKDSLKRVRFIEFGGRDKEWISAYDKAAPEWSREPDNRTEEQKAWFNNYISRDLGSDILYSIIKSDDKEIIIKNSISFAGDSLFCEYGYIIDFDSGKFEIYKGHNKEIIKKGRFVSGDCLLEKKGGYEPIKISKGYDIDDLPSEEQFLYDLSENEE